ncbi:hypothetical protein [Bacillus phage vB_BceS-M2]
MTITQFTLNKTEGGYHKRPFFIAQKNIFIKSNN